MTERGGSRLLRGVVVGLAIALGVVAWLATRGGEPEPVGETVRVVSPAELAEAGDAHEQPVYWAGPLPGAELKLIESERGVQLRYQRDGSEPADALTVGTYPLPDPVQALREFGREPGAVERRGADGRVVLTNEERPTSVYFADPGESVQVEVYDPSPERAMRIALSGRVRPVR